MDEAAIMLHLNPTGDMSSGNSLMPLAALVVRSRPVEGQPLGTCSSSTGDRSNGSGSGQAVPLPPMQSFPVRLQSGEVVDVVGLALPLMEGDLHSRIHQWHRNWEPTPEYPHPQPGK
jgi:hypothetical protein